MFNPVKYFRNRKVGLALGSGGAKGLAHIAVIEYLGNMGIPIDMIAGSSIGAVVGALYCAGSMQRFKDDIMKLGIKELISYMDPVIPRSGLLEGKNFVKFMERYIAPDALIEDLPIPLCIVATDYLNGTSVQFRSGSILEALRASVSIPGILVPVRYKGTLLVDGGVANPLPVNIVEGMGAGITIAVNLHPRIYSKGLRRYVRTKEDKASITVDSRDIEIVTDETELEMPTKTGRVRFLKSIEHWLKLDKPRKKSDLPSIFEVISTTIDIMEYVNTMLLLKYNSPSVLIEPSILEVTTLDFTQAERIIAEGHRACDEVRRALVRNVSFWI